MPGGALQGIRIVDLGQGVDAGLTMELDRLRQQPLSLLDLAGLVVGVFVGFRVSAPIGDFLADRFDVTPEWAGVTCPGPIDRGTGSMKPIGMPTWHDFPVRRELAAITELPVSVDTPGRALALAELWCGDAADGPPDRDGRGRHVPGRGRRAADDLGRAGRCRHRAQHSPVLLSPHS